MSKRVYVTRVIPSAGVDLLRRHDLQVDVNESDTPLSPSELAARAGEYDALVTLLTDQVDERVLQAGSAGRLGIVANVAVGFDNIDIGAASRAGIAVSNTPGVLTETTADFAWALLMATARRIPEGDRFFRAGKYHGWGILMLLGEDVHGKTLGLVGFGRIGQAMAKRAAGFGMRVLFYDPVFDGGAEANTLGALGVDMETLLTESDFVSLHVPLLPETRHLISARELSKMKPTACLINTSRGPVIDEDALVNALRAGEISAAGLDVYENEPEPATGLVDLQNVVLTPHIASASRETRERMATVAAENVIAYFSGTQPPNLLNPDVWTSAQRSTG